MSQQRRTITDHYADHVTQCQQRWERALTAEGFDAAVIHSGSQVFSFLDDYHYPFRPNPHFLQWLPLTHHHDSALVVVPGRRPVLWYYQPDDYWYTPPSDPASWWADHFDVRPVREDDAWVSGVPDGGRTAFVGDAPGLAAIADGADINPGRLVNRIHLDRTRKTPYELACMAEANRVAAVSHLEAERAFREGCSEYQIHQRYCAAGRQLDHELPYGNIVALNEHGAVLHYQDRDRSPPERSHSFLIDAGATQQAYASDITRTYSAQPDDEFAQMIAAMDAMQQQLCGQVRAGLDYRDLHLETHLRIAGILADFDLVSVAPERAVETGLSSVFYPHGLGHFIGLQTHDVAGLIADPDGTEIPRPEGHPFLRLTRVLEEGNVLTVEPGLYFIDSLLRKWREQRDEAAINWSRVEALAPFGGIRIEDNVVVTAGEPVNLSRAAFAQAR
ncbi:MAG: Xaa-Pro dipeptidase [Xanthomonadales bacterium]|nr:Xaa-Pro dipeptidase [Xanthomonadales bacterium]